jgi:universal stress protein E
MKPVSSILVVVDRSPAAADATAKAVLLARQFKARVELFMCDAERAYALSQEYIPTGVEEARQACVADSHRYLEALKRSAAAADVSITIDAGCDSPLYESIVRKVLRERPDLVIKNVAGTPCRLDTTDWQLMRACPATLMLTRGRPWQSPPRFAAAVDASAAESAGLARDILQAAQLLTGSMGGDLDVLYAQSMDMDEDQREMGNRAVHELVRRLPETAPSVHVLAGTPEVSLPRFAKGRSYDAMLLGALTHRPGITAQVGTLTSRLVEGLECDFVLVKPTAYHCPVGESYGRPIAQPSSEMAAKGPVWNRIHAI